MNHTTIEKCRKIIRDRQAQKIDGLLMDAFTAQVIVLVYDSLSEPGQAKMATMGIEKMARVAMKLVK